MLRPRNESAFTGSSGIQDTECLGTPVSGRSARSVALFFFKKCVMGNVGAGAQRPLLKLRWGHGSSPPRRKGGEVDALNACPRLALAQPPPRQG